MQGLVVAVYGKRYQVELSDKSRLSCVTRGKKTDLACRDNVVIKLTAANGWRREWDMEFRDGVPRWVTLAQFAPDGAVSIHPAPQRISAEHFFGEFAKEWGSLGDTEEPQ